MIDANIMRHAPDVTKVAPTAYEDWAMDGQVKSSAAIKDQWHSQFLFF